MSATSSSHHPVEGRVADLRGRVGTDDRLEVGLAAEVAGDEGGVDPGPPAARGCLQPQPIVNAVVDTLAAS